MKKDWVVVSTKKSLQSLHFLRVVKQATMQEALAAWTSLDGKNFIYVGIIEKDFAVGNGLTGLPHPSRPEFDRWINNFFLEWNKANFVPEDGGVCIKVEEQQGRLHFAVQA